MKKMLLAGAFLLVWALPALAGEQCALAEKFGWASPSQNSMCVYEFLFELMGGW